MRKLFLEHAWVHARHRRMEGMEVLYEARYRVAWVDIDMNGHMANSRYLDYATQTRLQYIASRGFSLNDFQH
ncbi:MAG: thioesterase, partial [Acidobacteriota bacterium]